MIFGDIGGLKLPDICLTGEEKPRKNLTQETCPDRWSNPGPLRDKLAWCHLAHNGGLRASIKFINNFKDDYGISSRHIITFNASKDIVEYHSVRQKNNFVEVNKYYF